MKIKIRLFKNKVYEGKEENGNILAYIKGINGYEWCKVSQAIACEVLDDEI